MKRASYRDAIRWIADNDDTEWLTEKHGIPCVTVNLVADLFDVDENKIVSALRRYIRQQSKHAVESNAP